MIAQEQYLEAKKIVEQYEQQINILIISNNLFNDSKALEGKALEALNEAMKKSTKKRPTLDGRL